MGGFIENERRVLVLESFQGGDALPGFGRKKASEVKGVGGETGGGEGSEERRGSGDWLHDDACADSGVDETVAWVGDEGDTGVGDQGSRLSGEESRAQFFGPF